MKYSGFQNFLASIALMGFAYLVVMISIEEFVSRPLAEEGACLFKKEYLKKDSRLQKEIFLMGCKPSTFKKGN